MKATFNKRLGFLFLRADTGCIAARGCFFHVIVFVAVGLLTNMFCVFPSAAQNTDTYGNLTKNLTKNIYKYGAEDVRISLEGCELKIERSIVNCFSDENTKKVVNYICLSEIKFVSLFENERSDSLNMIIRSRVGSEVGGVYGEKELVNDEAFKNYCETDGVSGTETVNYQCNGNFYLDADPVGPIVRVNSGAGRGLTSDLNRYINFYCK